MINTEFYAATRTEEDTIVFLRRRGLLRDVNNLPPCRKPGCNGIMRLAKKTWTRTDGTRATSERYVCRVRTCNTSQSLRDSNPFFTIFDMTGRSNSHLTMSKILEIVFLWCQDVSCAHIRERTGLSHETVIRWMDRCRDVCIRKWKKRGKMGGPGKTIQADESLLRGRRKANKGRLLAGDKKRRRLDDNAAAGGPQVAALQADPLAGGEEGDDDYSGSWELYVPPHDEVEEPKGDYGDKRPGPWVFGMVEPLQKIINGKQRTVWDKRFFMVAHRDRPTLHGIIRREVRTRSRVHTDEWRAYWTLEQHGYIHETVNHSHNFVDPNTGVHTQLIECMWGPLKLKVNFTAVIM